MKKLLLGIAGLLMAGGLNAQVEIHIDGAGPDVSGTIVDVTFDGSDVVPLEVHMDVTNNTGSDQQWRIRRVRENVPSDWSDNICWPPQCYLTNGVQSFWTPHSGTTPAPTIVDGSDTTTTGLGAQIKPQYFPGSTNAYAMFWYYITDVAGNKVDSVGVRIYYYVGLEDLKPSLDLSVSPNPATDHINVKAEGVSEADLKVVDILGNVIIDEKITGTKTIDVMDLNNGVYFVIIESEGLKPVNKKVVIRH